MLRAGSLLPTFLWPAWVRGCEFPRSGALEREAGTSRENSQDFSNPHLGPDLAPRDVVVSSIAGSTGLLVTWQRGSGELQEHVVDWARDGDPLEDLSWIRLPPENLSALLPGEAVGHLGSHPSSCPAE